MNVCGKDSNIWSWVRTLSETGWMYASVSVVHYFSIFISIGTAVIPGFAASLDFVAPRQRVKQLAEQLSPVDVDLPGSGLAAGLPGIFG